MLDFAHSVSGNPYALMGLLILSSWVWEDLSVITGALLAADGMLTIPFAVVSVFVGIASGDMALYYFGRSAIRWRCLRYKLVTNSRYRQLQRRFQQKLFSNIFLIRFVPGLRTLGFTLCGLWKIPQTQFAAAMSGACVLWILVVFSLVYQLGSSRWLENSQWKYSLVAGALLLLVVNNYIASRSIRSGVTKKTDRN